MASNGFDDPGLSEVPVVGDLAWDGVISEVKAVDVTVTSVLVGPPAGGKSGALLYARE